MTDNRDKPDQESAICFEVKAISLNSPQWLAKKTGHFGLVIVPFTGWFWNKKNHSYLHL